MSVYRVYFWRKLRDYEELSTVKWPNDIVMILINYY